MTCFQKQPPLFLKVSQIPQENTCVGVSFFLKMIKLCKGICSAWISRTRAIFFLEDWRHKRLKNTIDLLLFYGEHFYGFLQSGLWKRQKKTPFHNKHIYIYGSQTFWCFMKFYFAHIVRVCFVFKKHIWRNISIMTCLYSSIHAQNTSNIRKWERTIEN